MKKKPALFVFRFIYLVPFLLLLLFLLYLVIVVRAARHQLNVPGTHSQYNQISHHIIPTT